jgi:hypothetical protein
LKLSQLTTQASGMRESSLAWELEDVPANASWLVDSATAYLYFLPLHLLCEMSGMERNS